MKKSTKSNRALSQEWTDILYADGNIALDEWRKRTEELSGLDADLKLLKCEES